jgi:Protein of unknown function (DUF3307)
MEHLFFLLFVYQIKHFVCDYLLQGKWMLGKFKDFPDYILPLLAHVSVHGVATFLIASACHTTASPLALALFDMVVHFIMDRIKASPKFLGRFKPLTAITYKQAYLMSKGLNLIDGEPLPSDTPISVRKNYMATGRKDLKSNTFFWFSLGIDQGIHHLTHYVIIYWLMS